MFSLTFKATQSHFALKMAKSKSVKIDYSEFTRKTQELARQFKVDEVKFVKEQSALLARDAARFTPPYASFPKKSGNGVGTARDIKMGRWAMENDLYKICSIRKKPTITWAKKAFGIAPVVFEGQAAACVIDNISDLHRWHNKHRNKRNRTKMLSYTEKCWTSQVVFNKYLKTQYPKVGRAKAAFLKSAIALGGNSKAPKNVLLNLGRASGTGKMKKSLRGSVGIITARAGGLAHTIRLVPMLQKDRLLKARRRLQILVKAAAKKARLKVV